jgi:hypothetical protein
MFPLLLLTGAVFVVATGWLTETGVYLTSTSFLYPGLDSLLAIFSKGFLVSTLIYGCLSSLLLSLGLSFFASLYLSRVDLL